MPRYIITYDLVNRKDYGPLIDEIKKYRKWAHPLASVWIVVTEKSASQIRDELRKHLDGDDKIIVMKTARGASWVGLNSKVSAWIKNNPAD